MLSFSVIRLCSQAWDYVRILDPVKGSPSKSELEDLQDITSSRDLVRGKHVEQESNPRSRASWGAKSRLYHRSANAFWAYDVNALSTSISHHQIKIYCNY